LSGHSKWATIKRKKGAKDAARGKLFGKLIRYVEVAARESGGDPDTNPSLATAIAKARAASMPMENITRAIKRGTGELEGVQYEESSYEGYGPGGVAIYVIVLTDNRNRAASDVRSAFQKNNGSLGEPGSVAWKFEMKGVLTIPLEGIEEDDLLETVLDAGAEDVLTEGDLYEVRCEPSDLRAVLSAATEAGFPVESSDTTMIPQQTTPVNERTALTVLRLVETLEDLDDVQDVYADFDIPEEVMAQLS